MRKILAIARFTCSKPRAAACPGWSSAQFGAQLGQPLVRELAITDSQRLQLAFLATALRATSALLTRLHHQQPATRVQRQSAALVLALDVPRSHFVLGKAAATSRQCSSR